ncbi:NADH-quinone oxidoreductase subunit M, partial [Buchnera aphidicola]|nr:NADH-quinone oxidoreductase subunit M [Buchnera aphidicola]
DSFSLLMILLTSFLGIISILSAWHDIKNHQGFFYFNLMLILTGTIGIFVSFDLFLFFFFWEMMLIPMYFLISIWGNTLKNKKNRMIV